jgi:hypothetical protein
LGIQWFHHYWLSQQLGGCTVSNTLSPHTGADLNFLWCHNRHQQEQAALVQAIKEAWYWLVANGAEMVPLVLSEAINNTRFMEVLCRRSGVVPSCEMSTRFVAS